MRLPDGDGLELVEWIQREAPGTPVAVITAHGSVEVAARALKLGAFDFVSEPLDLNDLRKLVTVALKAQVLPRREPKAAAHRCSCWPFSPRWSACAQSSPKVARSQVPIHISGRIRHG